MPALGPERRVEEIRKDPRHYSKKRNALIMERGDAQSRLARCSERKT